MNSNPKQKITFFIIFVLKDIKLINYFIFNLYIYIFIFEETYDVYFSMFKLAIIWRIYAISTYSNNN